jgi:tetratricopeptide (TPR) repeat protein
MLDGRRAFLPPGWRPCYGALGKQVRRFVPQAGNRSTWRLPESKEFLELAIDIRLELRGALNALDQMGEVHGFLSEATALADKLSDKRRQALVAALMTQSLDMIGQHELAAQSARRALEIAGPLGDSAIVIVANYMLYQPLWHLGQVGQASLALKRCIDVLPQDLAYLPFGMVTYPAVVAHAALTSRLADLGEFAEAGHHAALTLERTGQLDHAYTTVFAWLCVGYFHARRGDTEAAIPVLERAIELCWTAEIRRQNVPCASVLCYAYAVAGRQSDAHKLLDRTFEDVGSGWGATATWLPWLSEGAMLVGRNAEALEITERA